MTWLMIGKILLLGFLVLGCGVLVIAYIRRRRAGVKPLRDPNASAYLDLLNGRVPPTPLPEWVDWDEASDDDSTAPYRTRSRQPPAR